jgi:hypothetical protein
MYECVGVIMCISLIVGSFSRENEEIREVERHEYEQANSMPAPVRALACMITIDGIYLSPILSDTLRL